MASGDKINKFSFCPERMLKIALTHLKVERARARVRTRTL